MKITNVLVGRALLLAILFFLSLFVLPWAIPLTGNDEVGYSVTVFLSACACVLIAGYFVIGMIDSSIKFEFTIPNPISDWRDGIREKRRLAEALREVYLQMQAARGTDLDELIIKAEALRRGLGEE